jgi:hypothetical protein
MTDKKSENANNLKADFSRRSVYNKNNQKNSKKLRKRFASEDCIGRFASKRFAFGRQSAFLSNGLEKTEAKFHKKRRKQK